MFYTPYIFNGYWMPFPPIPNNCDKPPTIYSLLESIVNYGKDEKTKIKDLAKVGRSTIFDFDYPLSNKITKEEFETMILNHYLQRRIGFDTLTAFKIQLNVKLNDIMPLYNKMFDSISGWDIFKDGEKTSRYGTDNREISSNQDTSSASHTTNNLNNETNSSNVSDRRNSNTPQNHLENVRNGSYVTDYNYDTNSATDNSRSNGISDNTTTGRNITNTNDDNIYNETIEKTSANKIEILKQLQQEIKSVYSLIFKDLDDLFYSVI